MPRDEEPQSPMALGRQTGKVQGLANAGASEGNRLQAAIGVMGPDDSAVVPGQSGAEVLAELPEDDPKDGP